MDTARFGGPFRIGGRGSLRRCSLNGVVRVGSMCPIGLALGKVTVRRRDATVLTYLNPSFVIQTGGKRSDSTALVGFSGTNHTAKFSLIGYTFRPSSAYTRPEPRVLVPIDLARRG